MHDLKTFDPAFNLPCPFHCLLVNITHFSCNCGHKKSYNFCHEVLLSLCCLISFPQRTFYLSIDDINITDGVMLKGNFNVNELRENKISNVAAFLCL